MSGLRKKSGRRQYPAVVTVPNQGNKDQLISQARREGRTSGPHQAKSFRQTEVLVSWQFRQLRHVCLERMPPSSH